MSVPSWAEQQKAKSEWLSSLKAGDEVCVRGYGAGRQAPAIHKVVRTTASQIIISRHFGERFRMKDGQVIGQTYRGELIPLDDTIRDQIFRAETMSEFSCSVRESLTHEERLAMLEALKSYRAARAV